MENQEVFDWKDFGNDIFIGAETRAKATPIVYSPERAKRKYIKRKLKLLTIDRSKEEVIHTIGEGIPSTDGLVKSIKIVFMDKISGEPFAQSIT